ncbi:hypothetical protein GCM10019016_139790 [Streptomyces prasinosporus]|uniref:Peptidase S8/S53 domain-containing protein n=1 Tax=Streptomyces prasinosporus TaxID=68256 RepID=A0ABP6UHA7_9ACTN
MRKRPAALGGLLAAALVLIPATPAYADGIRDRQWALDALHTDQVWPTTRGAGVTVAVLDTGVEADHPDLDGNVLRMTRPTGWRPGRVHLFTSTRSWATGRLQATDSPPWSDLFIGHASPAASAATDPGRSRAAVRRPGSSPGTIAVRQLLPAGKTARRSARDRRGRRRPAAATPRSGGQLAGP